VIAPGGFGPLSMQESPDPALGPGQDPTRTSCAPEANIESIV